MDTTEDPMHETWNSLPNWELHPDPEIPGMSMWVHLDYDQKPDIAIVQGEQGIDVLTHVMIGEGEIDGEWMGTWASWDAALDAALAMQEISPR